MRASVSVKVIMAMVVVVAIATTAAGIQNIRAEREVLAEQADILGRTLASAAAVFTLDALLADDLGVMSQYVQTLARGKDDVVFARIENKAGKTVAEYPASSGELSPDENSFAEYAAAVFVDPDSESMKVGRVVLGISTKRAEKFQEERTTDFILQSVILFVVLGTVLGLMMRQVVGRPLRILDGHAMVLAKGNLDQPIELASVDELGRLAQTLDGMRRSLRDREEDLRSLNVSLEVHNKELIAALTSAQEATRIKNEFIANISHELRTPLNTIINIPEGLLGDFAHAATCESCQATFALESTDEITESTECPDCKTLGRFTVTRVYTGEPQQTARYLKTVHRSGKHLLQVINDLLNFSTLEAGKAHLHLEPLDVRDVISELSENMQSIAIQRGITIETKVPTIDEFKAAGHERPELIADAVKLSQVLINLTSNAIKFSPDNGVVRVDAEVREDKVRFTVADQGIGIPKDKQSLVFESFRQADGSHTRRFGGTGLGLAISKGIVELHQGEIWLESDEGEGSTFFVELPIAGPSREEPEQVSELGGLASMTDAVKGILDRGRAAGDDEQRTVLVVDDDPSVVETVELALQGFNCRVLGLTDSTTAVEQIKKVQPDLLILDIMMPGTSGISILRELRTSNLRNLPVLVSSAYHQNKEVVMALHAEWISKPWQMETIAAEVARMLKVSEFVMGTRERRS